MEYRLLGSLEVLTGDSAFQIDAHKPRVVLALLLLHANEVVPRDRLIEDLWHGEPPMSGPKLLQTYVSQLRRALGPTRIATRGPGYAIAVAPGELDIDEFERLRPTDPHAALALWRGEALADFTYEPWAQGEIARLAEARLATIEDRFDLDLARGLHADLIADLRALVDAHPLRERLRGQLMLALYRCGRQADALGAYREGRRLLVDELGLEPSVTLQELERAILRQDSSLDATPVAQVGNAEALIGREHVIAEIAALLRRERMVTLTGPGGVGKTRLAVEMAQRAAAGYAEGAAVVELAPIADPARVADEIARVLGVPDAPDALGSYLRAKQMLILLDNFEQVAEATPLVGGLLTSAPELTILITSRTRLRIGAEYVVPPLDAPEAVSLFVERARATRAGFELDDANAAAVTELCVRLDRLPLALELAAARVDLLSPSAILDRLGRRLELLATRDAEVPTRHRTLKATIEWSYDLLAPSQRELFSSLAVFRNSFSVDAAEAVADRDLLDEIAGLVDSSLVRPEEAVADEPRFGMLETIRAYAVERLAEREDEPQLRHRHAVFYASLAEQAEPALRGRDQVRWLRRLDADRANILAALSGSGEPRLVMQIAGDLWRYWQVRGGIETGRAHIESALAANGSGDRAERATALGAAARLAYMQGDSDATVRLADESMTLLAELGAPVPALTLVVRAGAEQARGNAVRAAELLEASLGASQASSDWFARALALISKGELLVASGEYGGGRRTLEEGVRAAREAGDLRNVARGLTSLSSAALEQRDYDEATRFLDEALTIQRELGDRWGVPRTLVGLGIAALGRHDHETAGLLFDQALALQVEVDDRPGIATSLEHAGALAAELGEHEPAALLLGAAASLREMVGDHPMQPAHHTHDNAVAAATDALGDDVFADAWSRGRALTVNEAVSYAMARDRRSADAHHPVD